MKSIKTILAAIFMIAVGCTAKKSATDSDRALMVGTDAAYAPFEIESADKKLSGFDIEILTAVAEKAKLKLQFVNTPWEGLFTQLASGDRDILVSAITINDARKKQMDFSDPYFEAVQRIAVPAKSKVAGVQDLKPLKVGVQTGTTGDDIISALLGKNNPNVKRFESTPLAIKELQNGGIDAVVADNGVLAHFLKNNSTDFKVLADTTFSKEHYGFAVKKGNQALLDKINQGLKAVRADGTYQKIFETYFGTDKTP